MNVHKGYSLIEIMIVLVAVALVMPMIMTYINTTLAIARSNVSVVVSDVKEHMVLDLLIKELMKAPRCPNRWLILQPHILCWLVDEQKARYWEIKGNTLIRKEGEYDINIARWSKASTIHIKLMPNKISFSYSLSPLNNAKRGANIKYIILQVQKNNSCMYYPVMLQGEV